MEQIQHKFIEVQGLKLHVAEIGSGPNVVVFLHGFPEIWYSWRHQMVAVAEAGFRVLAPDSRGYGLSDPPLEPEKASFGDLIEDLGALLDALGIDKVFLVAKDFGAFVAYLFSLLHQERVQGVMTLGFPHRSPSHLLKYHEHLPEGFYISRWQEPGRAEADFGRLDAKTVVRNIYILFSRSEIPIAAENQEIMDIVDPSTPLPSWFTEGDLEEYGSLYRKSGFRTALQVPYRSIKEDLGITDYIVKVPALLVMGEKDYGFKFAGAEEYVRSGKVKEFVPQLEIVFAPEGTHFIQEQSPDVVNQLILDFLKKHI
ncbi:AB hydrolase superfamily protein YfhM isoform X1 [Eucalyptus grandis]|uniref:AB hydrolase superfamily protein YfhM isoform X1 n=1 Tax=Eucalyptus grandis TaxID=71139 RepID=UPI00192EA2BF|nr:AB hydrolase superfamily protein YfhM isoform X1 [Eucalyptus grandis]